MRFILLVTGMIGLSVLPTQAQTMLKGVNLAGAEFDSGTFWPNAAEFSYFNNKGMNVYRIPFKWERLQPQLNQDFDLSYFNELVDVINTATDGSSFAILDPHNYARYNNALIGSASVPHSAFADLWSRLASTFSDNPQVIFGLMNEPNSMPTEQWLISANQAIAAIRMAGANQLILVPGNAWTGAHSWEQNWYGTPNAEVMLGVIDSADNFAFDLHQYFDADFSGTTDFCAADHGAAQLVAVSNWLRTHQKMGFLGEFAGADNLSCHQSIVSVIDYMEKNSDVWLGWSWWAAGPQWGNYIFTIEPTNDFQTDRPQMAWLLPYLFDSDLIFYSDFE